MTLDTLENGVMMRQNVDFDNAMSSASIINLSPRAAASASAAGWGFERSDSPPGTLAAERYGSVTRNASLTGETKPHFGALRTASSFPFFIDWISIEQVHSVELPIVSDGYVEAVNGEGEIEWKTLKAQSLEGSFSSKIMIRCDGTCVRLSGNVGRFGRADNLFGFDLQECIDKCNEILSHLGLPPFTAGESFLMQGSDTVSFTGAKITRLDLTCNYATGSPENAHDFLRWLGSQQDNRVKTGIYGESHTIDFGRGSKRVYHKVYNKFSQLSAMKDSHVSPEVLEWVRCNGIVRHEITLKARWLRDGGLRFLGVVSMDALNVVYLEKAAVIQRAEKSDDGFSQLPDNLRLTVRDYLAGEKFKGSRAKFYRHRRDLLSYGIDISVPSKVTALVPRVKVITLQQVSAPDWYWARSVAA